VFILFSKLERLSHLDADPNECALWMLLKRTFSADRAVRQQAVQELAQNHHWQGERQQHFNLMIRKYQDLLPLMFLLRKTKLFLLGVPLCPPEGKKTNHYIVCEL